MTKNTAASPVVTWAGTLGLLFRLCASSTASRPNSVVNLMMGFIRHRRSILERIADGVADNRGGVKIRSFLPQDDLNDLLGVIPRTAGVGHEDCLEQAEDRHGNQESNEEKRVDARVRQVLKNTTKKILTIPACA